MKFRKLNRGLLLTLVIVAGVAAYLVGLNVKHATDRQQINNLCNDYLPVYSQSLALTKEQSALTDAAFATQLEKLKTEASDKNLSYFASQDCFTPTMSEIETAYTTQNVTGIPISELNVSIKSVGSFQFDGNIGSAKIIYKVSYHGPTSLTDASSDGSDTLEQSYTGSSTITFQKVDGNWKIYYFDGNIFNTRYTV